MRIALVLKSGGDFTAAHVEDLRAQLARFTAREVIVLSDVAEVATHTLDYNWPGWWSKMELFRPDLGGDLFYLDLDTVITGPLDWLGGLVRPTMLRDFFHPANMASGVMYWPERARERLWNAFVRDAHGVMRLNRRGGDQRFIGSVMRGRVDYFQDREPGQVCSYKVDCRFRGVPDGASLVCFHGQPRPWGRAALADHAFQVSLKRRLQPPSLSSESAAPQSPGRAVAPIRPASFSVVD